MSPKEGGDLQGSGDREHNDGVDRAGENEEKSDGGGGHENRMDGESDCTDDGEVVIR